MNKCSECGAEMNTSGKIYHRQDCKYFDPISEKHLEKAAPGELKADHAAQLFHGGVKVMRSYDYCHFEVQLSSSEPKGLKEIDDMRKEAARLADKAVEQYAQHKGFLEWKAGIGGYSYTERCKRVDKILKEVPESERTPEQKAELKLLSDIQFHESRHFDYYDDWDDDYPEY